jgi:hypothetical protein
MQKLANFFSAYGIKKHVAVEMRFPMNLENECAKKWIKRVTKRKIIQWARLHRPKMAFVINFLFFIFFCEELVANAFFTTPKEKPLKKSLRQNSDFFYFIE